ncbi:MAG: hypothetical protein JWO78_1551 [Micavibrio sp.]|nr:hypothetical protein [Micavibrio sp.]
MKSIAKICLGVVFAASAIGIGYKFVQILPEVPQTKNAQVSLPPEVICTEKPETFVAAVQRATASAPAADTPSVASVTEMAGMDMSKHHHETIIPSTVDVHKALGVAGRGEIGFGDGVATVTVMDDNKISSHDFVFDFTGKGALCDDQSPVCSTMDVLSAAQKEDLTATICSRAKANGGGAFYQEFCDLKS